MVVYSRLESDGPDYEIAPKEARRGQSQEEEFVLISIVFSRLLQECDSEENKDAQFERGSP
jgi:hypothetical protein